MWRITVNLARSQQFAVALRLSRSPGASTELRIAIIDPSKCRQESNLLGSYELEKHIHEILDSAAPSMMAVTSFPDCADVQATAQREEGKDNAEIKILVSLKPVGTAARPEYIASPVPDHLQDLKDLVALQHQRELQHKKQQLRKARDTKSMAPRASSSNKFSGETNLFPALYNGQVSFEPSATQQRKRRLSYVGCDGGGYVQIISNPQDQQFNAPLLSYGNVSYKRLKYT
jgi:hypothetical protein